MGGTILMDHHAGQRPTLTFPAMLPALFGTPHRPCSLKFILHAGVAQPEAMLRQLLVEMPGRKVEILCLVQRD